MFSCSVWRNQSWEIKPSLFLSGREVWLDNSKVKSSSVSWQHLFYTKWLTTYAKPYDIMFHAWHASVQQITSIRWYICCSAWNVSSAKCERKEDKWMVMGICDNCKWKSGEFKSIPLFINLFPDFFADALSWAVTVFSKFVFWFLNYLTNEQMGVLSHI